jgi:poly-gamma-glutamate synthesis protein (capsule biosynthesis protein)
MNICNFSFIGIFFLGINCGFSQISSENTEELSLIFIGDFMGHLDQINAAYNSKTKTHDYNDCFKYVKPILSEADITIGNLEVTLGIQPYSGYPQFSSPATYASAIKPMAPMEFFQRIQML